MAPLRPNGVAGSGSVWFSVYTVYGYGICIMVYIGYWICMLIIKVSSPQCAAKKHSFGQQLPTVRIPYTNMVYYIYYTYVLHKTIYIVLFYCKRNLAAIAAIWNLESINTKAK